MLAHAIYSSLMRSVMITRINTILQISFITKRLDLPTLNFKRNLYKEGHIIGLKPRNSNIAYDEKEKLKKIADNILNTISIINTYDIDTEVIDNDDSEISTLQTNDNYSNTKRQRNTEMADFSLPSH